MNLITPSLLAFVYSGRPSFALPVAACEPPVCPTPTGSYINSCHSPQVIYLPEGDECEFTALCRKTHECFSDWQASIRFPRDTGIVLKNQNGTLVMQLSQPGAIETLRAGHVVTLDDDLDPILIAPAKWSEYDEAFNAFPQIAEWTGGLMGYAPSATSLTPLLEKMSAHILHDAESIDIAFAFDTTLSMQPYLEQVQKELIQFLQHLQKNTQTCRVALVEYRDLDQGFLNRVDVAFTSDLDRVQKEVENLVAGGGGDEPEAALDALLLAKNGLWWGHYAKRVVILITDAPPHPNTVDGLHNATTMARLYRDANISIYPMVVNTRGG